MESAIFLAPYSLAYLSFVCPAESHLPLQYHLLFLYHNLLLLLLLLLPLIQVCAPITHLSLHLAYVEVCIHTQWFNLHKSK